ncbi:hypothetical protein [Rhodococcus qingshengii]|uniref:Uncharacterized protein n=1 Tax=Rhodococcus qingshengii TaxID=334542 RepID=A0A2A5J3Q2_RHOSG|nr:hypothetical protein [Rhodococcus qingshengii]PCK24133.1 hypothetical protein CHR55_27210 [Rhodococcus qingshengii]
MTDTADQLNPLPLAEDRASIRRKIADVWLYEIARQPMSLCADDGTKVLALAELTLRMVEESGYARSAS